MSLNASKCLVTLHGFIFYSLLMLFSYNGMLKAKKSSMVPENEFHFKEKVYCKRHILFYNFFSSTYMFKCFFFFQETPKPTKVSTTVKGVKQVCILLWFILSVDYGSYVMLFFIVIIITLYPHQPCFPHFAFNFHAFICNACLLCWRKLIFILFIFILIDFYSD